MRTDGSSTLPGVLLLRGAPAKVASWVGRGTIPCYVVPLGGWTAVVPAGPSQAAPPYDQALTVLAARPVPGPLRATVGLFMLGHPDRVVVVVRQKSMRAGELWLTWVPGHGSMEVPGFASVNVRDLLALSGLAESERSGVLRVLGRKDGDPRVLARDLLAGLGLPGAELLSGTGVPLREDATLVTPDPRAVERFDRDVAEEREMRQAVESGPPDEPISTKHQGRRP